MKGLIKKNHRLKYTKNVTIRFLENVKESLQKTTGVKFKKVKGSIELKVRKCLNNWKKYAQKVDEVIKHNRKGRK